MDTVLDTTPLFLRNSADEVVAVVNLPVFFQLNFDNASIEFNEFEIGQERYTAKFTFFFINNYNNNSFSHPNSMTIEFVITDSSLFNHLLKGITADEENDAVPKLKFEAVSETHAGNMEFLTKLPVLNISYYDFGDGGFDQHSYMKITNR